LIEELEAEDETAALYYHKETETLFSLHYRQQMCSRKIPYAITPNTEGETLAEKPKIVRKNLLQQSSSSGASQILYYNDLLYITHQNIVIMDPREQKVLRVIASPHPEERIYSMAIHGETLLVATDKQVYCISLIMLEGSKEYLESIPVWEKFKVTAEAEATSEYRDERDNSFLFYAQTFGTPVHMEYIFKNKPDKFDIWKGNKYGECAFGLALKVTVIVTIKIILEGWERNGNIRLWLNRK
jgi:uncharacterized membrane protein